MQHSEAEEIRKNFEQEIEKIGSLSELEQLRIKYFSRSGIITRLFDELIGDKLAISEIMLLLKEKPLSTGRISEVLGLSPSEVSRHMQSSSRQGLVRYDAREKCFALA